MKVYLDSLPEVAKLRPRPPRVLNAMAAPREWEVGQGNVPALTPELSGLRRVQSGALSPAEYFAQFRVQLAGRASTLKPGALQVRTARGLSPVQDGDTIGCACPRGNQVSLFGHGPACHLALAAEALREAGWDVELWGREGGRHDG